MGKPTPTIVTGGELILGWYISLGLGQHAFHLLSCLNDDIHPIGGGLRLPPAIILFVSGG